MKGLLIGTTFEMVNGGIKAWFWMTSMIKHHNENQQKMTGNNSFLNN
jgi:hypothetical protein